MQRLLWYNTKTVKILVLYVSDSLKPNCNVFVKFAFLMKSFWTRHFFTKETKTNTRKQFLSEFCLKHLVTIFSWVIKFKIRKNWPFSRSLNTQISCNIWIVTSEKHLLLCWYREIKRNCLKFIKWNICLPVTFQQKRGVFFNNRFSMLTIQLNENAFFKILKWNYKLDIFTNKLLRARQL